MKNIVILLIPAFVLLNSCTKEECKFDYPNYVFEIPSSFSPQKETYKIGDTIIIESTFPNSVYDRSTQRNYVLKNFKFFPEFTIIKISNKISDRAAFFMFDVIIEPQYNITYFYGSASKVLSYYGQFLNEISSYNLKLSIVPKDTGLFVFHHSSSIDWDGIGDQEQEFEGKCDKKGLKVFVNMNENNENNINLLIQSPDEHYNTWVLEKPVDRFHSLGGYAFYVK